MSKYKCPKCENTTFYKKDMPFTIDGEQRKHVTLYCDKCDRYIKHLSKHENQDYPVR